MGSGVIVVWWLYCIGFVYSNGVVECRSVISRWYGLVEGIGFLGGSFFVR